MNEASNISALFAVDLRSGELLSEAVEEFLSVNVIPVPSDRPPSILTPVKIHVLLPLDRELFLKGTVILHKPGGFLVQVETPIDLTFLRLTVRDAAIEKLKEAKHQHDSTGEPSGLRPDPLLDERNKPAEPPVRRTESRQIPVADRLATRPETRIKRTVNPVDSSKIDIEFASEMDDVIDDEFDVSSITAVDDVTGQARHAGRRPAPPPPPSPPPRVQPRATQHQVASQHAPTQAMWAVRDNQADQTDKSLTANEASQTTQSRLRPDETRGTGTQVMHPVIKPSAKPAGFDPVDELFALAADAGALDTTLSEENVVSTSEESTNPDYYRPPELSAPIPEASFRSTGAFEEQAITADGRDERADAEDESPENRELAIKIREMSPVEKQRLARQGRRIARRILIRDNDKTIHKFVFFNPEMRIDEIIEYTRWSGLAPEAIEYITANRSWMESRELVFNIVRNPSTPTELAVRYLIKLTANEWRVLSRPGVVKPAVMNQARKLLFEAEKKSAS